MDPKGQPCSSSKASSKMAALLKKQSEVQDELDKIERQIFDMETTYLAKSQESGNVLKGFESTSSQKINYPSKRSRKLQMEDRLFSLSSSTSFAASEIEKEREERKNSGKRKKGDAS